MRLFLWAMTSLVSLAGILFMILNWSQNNLIQSNRGVMTHHAQTTSHPGSWTRQEQAVFGDAILRQLRSIEDSVNRLNQKVDRIIEKR